MRQQLKITICLAVILILAIGLKILYFPRVHGHMAFYFHSTFWICGILISIFSLHLLWRSVTGRNDFKAPSSRAFWPNRRQTFRIIYPAFIRPTLIVEMIDGIKKRQLEFPIIDLSQEGSCFIDDGSLGQMMTFSGRIHFNTGDALAIAGEFIRKNDNHVSVQFNRAISWPVLLEEQRRVLVHMKPPLARRS